MRIIFLDIDGVLNCTESLRLVGKPRPFHRDSVAALNRILAETGASIVVSSSWRYGQTLTSLHEILVGEGVFPCAIVGKTVEPEQEGAFFVGCLPRGREIRAWLDTHPPVDSYVILDDDPEANVGVEHLRVVATDTNTGGLRDDHATRAIEILRTPLRQAVNQ